MELLERYLQAVRGYLLRRRKEDILKELGDNILSQMEDRAADLGRPLSEAEQGEVLKQHGHPVVAAARYGRVPLQYLIGPTLFPVYWYAVQLVTGFVAAFHLMIALVMLFTSRTLIGVMAETWGSFWVWEMSSLGALTLCFGLIEYFGKGKVPFKDSFEPRDLPELKKTSGPSPANSAVELVLGTFFIACWLILLHGPTPAFAATVPMHLAPIWYRLELPMYLQIALGMAAAYLHLFRPQWPQWRSILRLARDVVGVITFYFFISASKFVVFQGADLNLNSPVHMGKAVITMGQLINYAVDLGPGITMIIFFIDGFIEAARLIGRMRPAAPLSQGSKGIL